MRYLMIFLTLFTGAVCAQESSFDREFAKFDKDFERLNHWKAETPASKRIKTQVKDQPAAKAEVQPLDAGTEPADVSKDNAETNQASKTKIEPLTHSDLLGPQINDPVVRKKVQDLYKRPDVVVQQYVLPTN
jgi:hypothetical protein